MSRDPAAGVWVVVPAFNEAARVGRTLQGLCALGHQVVVVDDGSGDATAQAALRHPVWLLRHAVNCGQGTALRTGLEFALSRGASWLVTFDADGQHDPAEIDALLAPLRAGQADVAVGSRFLGRAEGIPAGRRLLLRGAVLFTRLFSGVRLTDAHNGLRALSRAAAQRIRLHQPRMAHASELIDQLRAHGQRWVEVPVTIRYSPETLAKGQDSWNALRIAGQLLVDRWIR
jgi:glycosyltransferase involved in cell wall biosynthesis